MLKADLDSGEWKDIVDRTCVCMGRMKTSVCFARAIHCLLATSIIGT